MSEKSKLSEDILERSILDAKKVKQIALQSAERALKNKYSNDLKKIYLGKLNEEIGDFNLDDGMLDEDYPLTEADNEVDPMQQNDPNDLGLGNDELENPLGGGEGGLGLDGQSDPQQPAGSNPLDQGPAPDPNSVSSVMNQIPPTYEDDFTVPGEGEEILIDLEDFDKDVNDDVDSFMNQEMSDPAGLYNDEEQDPLQQNLQQNNQQPGFDLASIQLDDNVLLEYIEKSLKNDELTKQFRQDLEIVSEQVSQLTKQLSKSNETLETMKKQNLRLVYQNKALIDDSLSEHQKQHIVKALNKAETLNEAKTIYETAKNSLKVKPQSNVLNAMNGTKATGTTNLLRESKKVLLPQADRWQELAGIKKVR